MDACAEGGNRPGVGTTSAGPPGRRSRAAFHFSGAAALVRLRARCARTRPGRETIAGLAAPDWGTRRLGGLAGDVGRRQIGGEIERRAIAHAPVCRRQAVVMSLGVAEDCACKPRKNFSPAYCEKFGHQRQPLASRRFVARLPIQRRGMEGRFREADRGPHRRISHRPSRIPCAGPAGRRQRDRP